MTKQIAGYTVELSSQDVKYNETDDVKTYIGVKFLGESPLLGKILLVGDFDFIGENDDGSGNMKFSAFIKDISDDESDKIIADNTALVQETALAILEDAISYAKQLNDEEINNDNN